MGSRQREGGCTITGTCILELKVTANERRKKKLLHCQGHETKFGTQFSFMPDFTLEIQYSSSPYISFFFLPSFPYYSAKFCCLCFQETHFWLQLFQTDSVAFVTFQ